MYIYTYVYAHTHLKVHRCPCAGQKPYSELGMNRCEARSRSNWVCTVYRVLYAQATLAAQPPGHNFQLPRPYFQLP